MNTALHVAAAQAQRQRDAAQRGVQWQQRIHHNAHAQLLQLQQYAQTTCQRWGLSAGHTVQPEVLHHYSQFMARLEHAIGLQTKVVQQHEQRLAHAAHTLQQAQLRLTALQRVVQKRQTEAVRRAQRHEQQASDERAALQWNNPLCPPL